MPSQGSNNIEDVQRTYAIVKSLSQFDDAEVRGILQTLVGEPTTEELCYLSCYFRAVANIESLLVLEHVRDFQATAMIARSLFEIAVDARLLKDTRDGPELMVAFTEIEKLRSARNIVAFEANNPGSVPEVDNYRDFITQFSSNIEAKAKRLWSGRPIVKIKHWTTMNLRERSEVLRPPFDRMYAVRYPQMSWFVHSGLTGVLNMQKETYPLISAIALQLAAESFMLLLSDVFRAFHIGKAKEKIEKMMKLAQRLPFADSQQQADELAAAMLR